MKKYIVLMVLPFILLSCSPVLKKELINSGLRDLPVSSMKSNADFYKGKLFILGGLIAKTKFSDEGSIIEAAYVPVDKRGSFESTKPTNIRFIAILPKDKGLIDPLIYRQNREITLAGKFIEFRTDKIDEMEYTYPVFSIEEIYLWDEQTDYTYYNAPTYYPWWGYYPYSWSPYGYRGYYPYIVVPKNTKGKKK